MIYPSNLARITQIGFGCENLDQVPWWCPFS